LIFAARYIIKRNIMIDSKRIILLIFILSSAISMDAQHTAALPQDVIMAVKRSDAETLSKSFNDNIEIILPHKTAVYSRKQAEMVLKDFFSTNKVTEFQLIHQGKKGNASFAIANYFSNRGRFRFTFLTKDKGGKIYIHQIRIENQDD